MKVAEAVGKFLEAQGIGHVFGVNGGANLHLIHGVNDVTRIKFIPTAHESGAGFAADAYGRITGIGCAMATSGPGATNLVTAIATSYYDPVAVLYITGNVASFRFGSRFGVRQYGFQETPICDIVKPITKFAATAMRPGDVLPILRSAVQFALSGRKGPVLVDIPDDVQRMDVDVCEFDNVTAPDFHRIPPPTLHVETVAQWVAGATRPVFYWGAGMRPYAKQALRLAEAIQVPIVTTWGAVDTIDHYHALNLGGGGTHGCRAANMAIQNADLVIALGTRLDTKATGGPQHFVREGRVVMVDIDQNELTKFRQLGRQLDLIVEADAGLFIEALLEQLVPALKGDWLEICWRWRELYRSRYGVINRIADTVGKDDIIVTDTGTGVGMVCQAFPFTGSQRLIHAFNMTPMGYGFAGAIGAACAAKGRIVRCIVGDGGAMMSLSELATIRRWELPVKIHLLDNKGHAMCRQTENQWFGGRHASTTVESGLGFPDWPTAFAAFGILDACIHDMNFDSTLIPQAKYGQALEDADPQLPWDEFKAQMIVEPLERR